MRIAIPVLGFARTGGYRVLSQLANSWIDDGHDVVFLSPSQSDIPYFPTKARIIWLDGVGRETAHGAKSWLPPGGIRGVLGWMWLLARGLSLRSDDYDVILANHSLTAWSVSSARTSARKYYYIQAFEPEYYAHSKGLRGRILRWLSVRSYHLNLTHVVNAAVYQQYRDLHPIGVVHPGIDLSVFSPREAVPSWEERPVTVGCIGRVEVTKGTRDVFDGFQLAVSLGFQGKLKVAYGGPDHPVLRSPLCEVVTPRNDVELAEFYRSLDVLVAPGTVQLGAVHYPVLESMACRVPVINTGYTPSKEDNSWIVPIHSPEAIAATLLKMSEQAELRLMRAENGLNAIKPFAWKEVSAEFIRLINLSSIRDGEMSLAICGGHS